ncbi:MAG: hypothetical protein NTX79_04635 [Candidatus Micrarchaeota archaeon]|nr:hypothetical protein [Candidatus Micrarchaeota archaeon]
MKKIVTGKTVQNTVGDKQTISANNAKFQHKSLLVHTVFGVSIVSANSSVYVKIGNEYVSKTADELQKGEEVLFGKDGIPGITIDKVSEALAKSDRYTATQPVLFKQNSDGTYTTSFKDALFHGMAALGWPDAGAVDRNAGELTCTQSIAAAEHIRAKLQEANVESVSSFQIRYGWLSGKTIAPMNKESVFSALEPIAPRLSELLKPDFAEAYKLYVVIRQTVMRAVSLILHGTGSEVHEEKEGEKAEHKEGISTKPEIKLVVEHFASDISRNYAAGRILGISQLVPSAEPSQSEKGEVFKGIVTTKLDDPSLKIKSLKQITVERSVLLPILNRIMYEFAVRERISADTSGAITGEKKPIGKALLGVITDELGLPIGHGDWVISKVNERFKKAGITPLLGPLPQGKKAYSKQVVGIFAKKLYNGEIDGIYDLPVGTIEKVFNYYFNLEKALPLDFEYAWFLRDFIVAKQTRQEQTGQAVSTGHELREMNRLNQKFIKMGLDGGLYRATNEVHTAIGMTEHVLEGAMDVLIYGGRITPMGALKMHSNIEQLKEKNMLHDDSLALVELHRIGFGHLEFLYPKADELVKPYF